MSQLVSHEAVAFFLGKDSREVKRLIAEEGLPVNAVPGPTREVKKVTLYGLWGWLVAANRGVDTWGGFENFCSVWGLSEKGRVAEKKAGKVVSCE